jgi:DNA-binding CsgD family transcriptional regulator
MPVAGSTADSSPAVAAYRLMAVAEARRRDGAPAADAWSDTVCAWAAAGDAWPLAYARFRWAEALCAEGRREEAPGPLRLAARTADALAADPLRQDVLALARRARIPLDEQAPVAPSAPEDDAPFGLTDREREVLSLVVAGRSNGQIAAALFISPKTVSVHVSNILAKLGVGGRVEAAAVAHRLGLVRPEV